MKKNYSVLLFALSLFLAVPGSIAQDESVLFNIHKRLSTPGYESRHDHDRMLFVGEIIALGPVFQGVCKTGVAQSVDFSVSEILLGGPPEPTVHAGYTNCTRVTLPSPPFTLHAKVIVYCFHNIGFKCLAPVPFTDDHLKKVKSWVAELSAEDHSAAP